MNNTFTLDLITDPSPYIRLATIDLFGDYRFMFISMMCAVGIALLIASSCAKRDKMSATTFLKLYWIELCVILSICIYGVWSLFHLVGIIEGI